MRISVPKISIHPTVILLAGLLAVMGEIQTLAVIAIALVNHESAHAFTAHYLGHRVPSISLTPFGAVAGIEDLQHLPLKDQALIAAAGPAFSMASALAALVGLLYLPERLNYFLADSVICNGILALFNLLPVLPLDGGRMVLAAFSGRFGMQRTANALTRCGILLGMSMILTSVWFAARYGICNLTLAFTGCYLAYTANLCEREFMSHWIHGIILKKTMIERKQMLPVKQIVVDQRCSLKSICRQLPTAAYYRITVVDTTDLKLKGMLEEAQIHDLLFKDMNMTFAEALRLSNGGIQC